MTEASRSALVLTISDRSFEGSRPDASGERLEARLRGLGFEVERRVVPDEVPRIAEAIVSTSSRKWSAGSRRWISSRPRRSRRTIVGTWSGGTL